VERQLWYRKLTIKDVDRDELPMAARWQSTQVGQDGTKSG
jgi:hypothetical protein